MLLIVTQGSKEEEHVLEGSNSEYSVLLLITNNKHMYCILAYVGIKREPTTSGHMVLLII